MLGPVPPSVQPARLDELEAAEFLIDKLKPTKSNAEFFDSMRRG